MRQKQMRARKNSKLKKIYIGQNLVSHQIWMYNDNILFSYNKNDLFYQNYTNQFITKEQYKDKTSVK